jgi:hypothetical protein
MSKQDESLLHLLSHMEFQYMLVIAVNCGGSSCECLPCFLWLNLKRKKSCLQSLIILLLLLQGSIAKQTWVAMLLQGQKEIQISWIKVMDPSLVGEASRLVLFQKLSLEI